MTATRVRHPSAPIDPAPGARLRDLRIARNMTQRELAAPRYTKAYISALENGLIRFSVAAGTYLAERLGVTIGVLLEGDREAALRAAIDALPTKLISPTKSGRPTRKVEVIEKARVLDLFGGPS